MGNETSDVKAEDAKKLDVEAGNPKPEHQPTGGEPEVTPSGIKPQNSVAVPKKDGPDTLYWYDQDDPTTNIASQQEPQKTADYERSEISSLDEQIDLTKEISNDLQNGRPISQELTKKQIDQLRKSRFLVLHSKTWGLIDDIGRAVAMHWSGAGRRRYYVPDPDTRSAEPFSLLTVVERLTVTEPTLLIVFDHSQIPFSPLVSRAYIGFGADEFLALLKRREVHMLVLSKSDTVQHVQKNESARGLIKYFSHIESQEQEKPEAAVLPDDLREETIFLVWCAAFFPDLSVDDILGIVNRMMDHSIATPERARKSKERLRKNWAAICAKCGLTVVVDAAGIARLNFEPPKSASTVEQYFRVRGRPDHIHALQMFLESGIMMELGGRSLQIAAASIATLAKADPSALGENLLLRSVIASRSHPDIAQWWESDDFDSQPVLLLNILQAEFVSLVRLGYCELASRSVKELSKLSPTLAIGLLNRCPADYIGESWYVDAYVDVLRLISTRKVRLKSFRRLIRIAIKRKYQVHDSPSPENSAGLARLTSRIHESATQLLFADYCSCFVDTALLGQHEQRKAIHGLLRSSESSEAIAKILVSPLKPELFWQSLSGWSWTAVPSKVDLWIRQRLLAEGPFAEVFAAAAPIFGEILDDALATMQRISSPFGIILGLVLLDHRVCIFDDKSAAPLSYQTPTTLKIVLRDDVAFRDTSMALAELSRRFAACSSLVGLAAQKGGPKNLDALGKIRRYLNRQSGMAISIRKSIEQEIRNEHRHDPCNGESASNSSQTDPSRKP